MTIIRTHVAHFLCLIFIVGCGGSTETAGVGDTAGPEPAAQLPVFSLAWSEHPSWSMFGVAQDRGLIRSEAGSTGDVENRCSVDIELKEVDYKQGITDFANGSVDAVCITNVDSVAVSLKRPCVAILPTSKGAPGSSESTPVADDTIAMVVIGKDVLSKPGAKDFADAIIDGFYEMNYLLQEPKERPVVLEQFGKRYSGPGSQDVAATIDKAGYYSGPDDGIKLFEDSVFQNETMPRVVTYCVDQSLVDSQPTVGFGDSNAQLNFDLAYMKKFRDL